MTPHRIYLDNSATSWPKPEAVYEAVDHYQREIGAPNGRSGYSHAQQSNRIVDRARRGVAALIGAKDPLQIVFGFNCTDVLNMAIRGIVRPGDHVVTTVCEHNSVLRPLRALSEDADVEVTYVPCDGHGYVSPEDIRAALRPDTRLVAVNHASNVTGCLQPIDEIGRIVRESRAFYLVDAAQSMGHVPLDVRNFEVDLMAAPGHKGLLGPLGTGVLYMRPGIECELKPFRCGGTGTQSDEDRQPDVLPDKYEPGNHNLPGLAGLAAAMDFLRAETVEAIHEHHTKLVARLIDGFRQIESVHIHGPLSTKNRTSVVSITVDGYAPQELGAARESAFGLQCRAGFQCAPRMHESLGTTAGGGTLRFSPGYATTIEEIDLAISALQEVASVAGAPHGIAQPMSNKDKQPWYKDGLKFQCTGCGDCCTGAPGFVWVNKDDIVKLAACTGMEPGDFEAKYVRDIGKRKSLKEEENFDCVFLDGKTRKCQVYEARPRQCRTWPFWDSNVRTPEAWESTCQACPGSGVGRLYQLGEIEAQKAVIRI